MGVAKAPTAGTGAPAPADLSTTILTCARPPAAHSASSDPVLHTALMRPGMRVDRTPTVAVFSSAILMVFFQKFFVFFEGCRLCEQMRLIL